MMSNSLPPPCTHPLGDGPPIDVEHYGVLYKRLQRNRQDAKELLAFLDSGDPGLTADARSLQAWRHTCEHILQVRFLSGSKASLSTGPFALPRFSDLASAHADAQALAMIRRQLALDAADVLDAERQRLRSRHHMLLDTLGEVGIVNRYARELLKTYRPLEPELEHQLRPLRADVEALRAVRAIIEDILSLHERIQVRREWLDSPSAEGFVPLDSAHLSPAISLAPLLTEARQHLRNNQRDDCRARLARFDSVASHFSSEA